MIVKAAKAAYEAETVQLDLALANKDEKGVMHHFLLCSKLRRKMLEAMKAELLERAPAQ